MSDFGGPGSRASTPYCIISTMKQLPTGTVTFLFTDIESSTRLWEAQQDHMESALERHDTILRQAIAHERGYIFKTGGAAFYASSWSH